MYVTVNNISVYPIIIILNCLVICLKLLVAWQTVQTLQFICVEVLQPSQPNEVMSNVVSLCNHTFTGQA